MIDTKALGGAYYAALGQKNIIEIQKYLHDDVTFTDPLETVKGKKAVLKIAQTFMDIFKSLTVMTKFGGEDQAIIIYVAEISEMLFLKAASLLTFKEGLISSIELFYDSKGFKR